MTSRLLTCVVCGDEFKPRHRAQIMCSAQCREQRQQQQIRRWFRTHDMTDYWRIKKREQRKRGAA